MTVDKPTYGSGLPSHNERPVSWMSLFRTARAPLAVLLLAAVGLIVPPQTDDMLAALTDGGRSAWLASFFFQLSLAVLSVSAWYWARTLIDARFDIEGTRADREKLLKDDPRINPFALAAVPWLIVILSVLLGLSLIPRGQILPNLVILLVWVALFAGLAAFSWTHPPATPEERSTERSTPGFRAWRRRVPARLRLLAKRAPGPAWLAAAIVAGALGLFALGAVASFVSWDVALPTWIAKTFPGPAAALICLGLMIGPLSVLTFISDGLNLSWTFKGQRLGLSRPPIILVLAIYVAVMPLLLSLHTVRVVSSDLVGKRDDLRKFFTEWAAVCAPKSGPVRPIIVAVSGGASRAGVWGASVLEKVEAASPTGSGPTVFAVSSVSGGSLGVAAYLAVLHDLSAEQRCARGSTDARKKQVAYLRDMPLAHDALGPLLAATVAVDIPRSVLSPFAAVVRVLTGSQPRGGDRAEWIERAFEGIWKDAAKERFILFDKAFLSLFYDAPHSIRPGMPIWIANGTEAGTGSRLLTVPFKPDSAVWPFPAAKDTLDALKGDVSISTAINNTARFPYLEPSGELLPYPPANQPPPLGQQLRILRGDSREVIDGGYFENEGLQTALDLAAWLRREGPKLVEGRLVAPIIVQATADGETKVVNKDVVRCGEGGDDDPTKPSPAKPLLQLLAPVFGLNNVRGGHSAALLRMAKLDYCDGWFFHFYLPGEKAGDVPLNWVLSDGTTKFIRDAIEDKDIGNAAEGQRLATTLAQQPE